MSRYPVAIFVTIQAESMILPLWCAGRNTSEIARELGLPEAEIANRIPRILEERRQRGKSMAVDTWDEPRIEELRRLYALGMSCSLIAAELGGGISRNAVIGKVSRLKMPLRGSGTRQPIEMDRTRKPTQASARIRVPAQPRKVQINAAQRETLRCVEVIPRNISLIDLEPNDCRYPYGDGPFLFCGQPTGANVSYCMPHLALSTGPGTPSERAANRASPSLVAA